MARKDIDDISDVETTGHEWDGIRELNNPMPRWWVWSFYATILWAIGYTIVYPAWPLVTGATSGVIGYSSRGEVAQAVARARVAAGEHIQPAQPAQQRVLGRPAPNATKLPQVAHRRFVVEPLQILNC